MRKSFKISSEVFQNPNLLSLLYNEMMTTLGDTYPELVAREKEAKLIIEHENDSYNKLRADLAKKWKDLVRMYPEVEELNDVDLAGFALGYTVFKKVCIYISKKPLFFQLLIRIIY